MSKVWKPIRKIVAALLSGLTTTGVMAVLDGVGVHVDQTLAGAIVTLAAVAAGYLVPSPTGSKAPTP
jgi:hypothetical protein